MGPKRLMPGLAMLVLAMALAIGAASWANTGRDGACVEWGRGPVGTGAPLQEPKGHGQENLPIIQRMSKPVKQDGLEFQLISDSVWPMPARTGKSDPATQLPTGESPVRFQLRITNHHKLAARLLSVVGMPILQSDDGKELKVHFFGNDHTCLPKRITLAAGQTITVKGSASLYTGGRYGTCLWWEDEFGTNWWIGGLKPGRYSLKLQYNTRQHAGENSWVGESGVWLGDARTAEVPVEIVELKASQPAVFKGVEARFQFTRTALLLRQREQSAFFESAEAMFRDEGSWQLEKVSEHGWKDDIEVMALAEPTWRMPAAGKQTQVCLGFRMRTVGKWWVRIIPSIASVSITSADGVELPVKKTAAKVSTEAPQLLALRPEFSDTIATSATLFHDSKTMMLAWADRTGRVWHVENLKPGRYAVRYVIRAEKGEPIQCLSYWVGEFRTAPVMIEIKE